MKRTTYILIGTYLGGLILILIGLFAIKSVFITQGQEITIDMSKETTQIDLTGIQAIKVEASFPPSLNYLDSKEFRVTQAEEGSTGSITLPASEYFKTEKNGNTLVIKLDLENINKDGNSISQLTVRGVNIFMEVPKTVMHIENQTLTPTRIEGLTNDSLNLAARSDILLNNCNIGSLSLSNDYWVSFSAENSSIRNIYANLDEISNWTFNNSSVQNQYLTGSKTGNRIPYNNQGGEIYWQPMNDDAELLLSIKDSSIITVKKK